MHTTPILHTYTVVATCHYSTDGLIEPSLKRRISSVLSRIRKGAVDAPAVTKWTFLYDWAAARPHTSQHLRRICLGADIGADQGRCAGGHLAALDLPADRAAADAQAKRLLSAWDEITASGTGAPGAFGPHHDRVHEDPDYDLEHARRDWWLANPQITRLATTLTAGGRIGHWLTLANLVDDLIQLDPKQFRDAWVRQTHLGDALIDRRGRWHTPDPTCDCRLGQRHTLIAQRHQYIARAANELYRLEPTDIAAAGACHIATPQ